jgi:hypothetical protein
VLDTSPTPVSIRQMPAHGADSDAVFGFRRRQTGAQDHPTNPSARINGRRNTFDAPAELETFTALGRSHILFFERPSAGNLRPHG